MPEKMSLRDWLPLAGLTASAFIFNTSEFMPIGLLSDIAADLQITEAHAGMLITIYAWVVALMSLPLMLLFCRMDYRRLLLGITVLFAVSHVFSSVATGFWTLLASRIGVACAHSIFWSIASPMAIRIVPDRFRSMAMGTVATGSSIATVVGLPLGRTIGLHMGWRMTFLAIAVVSFAILIYLCACFPKVPNRNSFSTRKMPMILSNRTLVGIFLFTVLIATAQFTTYSYIEPFLGQVARLPEDTITMTLTVFGGAGILGSYLFSKYFDRSPRAFLGLNIGLVVLSLLMLRLASASLAATLALCVVWGAVVTAFNVALQAQIIRYAPSDGTAVAMSIFSGIFNLGIGCGALFGGMVCTHLSISYIGYVGGSIALVAWLYLVGRLLVLMKRSDATL